MRKDSFKVSIIGRVKHGALREALKRLGWTQKYAAKHLKMSGVSFDNLINLKRLCKFTEYQKEKLMEMTGESIDDLFPPSVYSKKNDDRNRFEIPMDIPLSTSLGGGEPIMTLMAPDIELQRKELTDILNESISKLSERQRYVLDRKFADMTDSEIAKELKITPTAVTALERKAHRRLRIMIKNDYPNPGVYR